MVRTLRVEPNLLPLLQASLVEVPSQVALVVKNLPANAGDVRDLWVQYLGWEDPLEKAMGTHSSIPDWRIPWTQEPGRL